MSLSDPPQSSLKTASLSMLNQVDLLCDDFEDSWKQGARPRISDYLPRIDSTAQSTLLIELVRLEVTLRETSGETPSIDDYLLQFPDYSELITEILSEYRDRGQLAYIGQKYPRQIAHYQLQSPLGEGGFGSVWKAMDTQLKKLVALKVPRGHHLGSGEFQFFLREARATARLDHPNIVKVIHVGQDDDLAYIATEFIEGKNLQEWLKHHQPTPQQAAEICMKLARALQYAHDQGIVHRDIKPGNILIDAEETVRLTDFGLAKNQHDSIASTLVETGRLLGTPAYMSPEQASGKQDQIDHRSDIYSLGVVLYRLLTGELPFTGEPLVVIPKIKSESPPPPSYRNKSLPRHLETICLKTLEKRSQDRYQSAGALADDLERFLTGETIQARPVGVFRRAGRWARRNLPLTVLATALALTACAFLVVLAQRSKAIPPDFQRVSITTSPPDAKIVVVPLNELTLEPQPDQLIECEGTTPLTVDLPPGKYLIVAYLDDKRFHEVYRSVPTPDEIEAVQNGTAISTGMRFKHFKPLNDGSIEWMNISIPDETVTEGMALLEGSESFPVQFHLDKGSRTSSIGSFYIDSQEYSLEEWKRDEGTNDLIIDLNAKSIYEDLGLPESAPIRWSWFYAVTIAERLGKRLPTEKELVFAMTARGTQKYPWGNEFSQEASEITTFGPAGEPTFDCLKLPGQPPVYGLCSNVAEWTTTHFTPLGGSESPVILGGNMAVIEGDPRVTIELRDPWFRATAPAKEVKPGLGVRFVRSAKPRIKPEDF